MYNQTINTPRTGLNLLPEDVLVERKQNSKLILVNKLSIGVLVLIILITVGVITLRLSQEAPLKTAQQDLSSVQAKVNSLKEREEQLLTLKQQLSLINTLSGGDIKKRAFFNLMALSLPAEMTISDLDVDKTGKVTVTLSTTSIQSMETLLANLTNKERNSDLVAKIELDSLALGKEGLYRFSLGMAPK